MDASNSAQAAELKTSGTISTISQDVSTATAPASQDRTQTQPLSVVLEARSTVTVSKENKGSSDQTFRLMDLPPEVRTHIYSLAFIANIKHVNGIDHGAHDCNTKCYWTYWSRTRSEREIKMFEQKTKSLTAFRLHPLTQVSRQLRVETLPVFFGETNFEICLYSNFEDRARARRGDSLRTPPAQLKKIGILGMRAEVKTRLRSFKSAALFQDVTFKVASRDAGRTLVYVRIECLGRIGLQISSWDGPGMWSLGPNYFGREGVDATVEALKHAAEGIAKKALFRGFTLRDVEEMARTFRFKDG
ncbi:unnamed protein product [Zymoseptoria tritici ST99CH_3D7]|uniref:F-box domain-containing protein n=1 Tax=Zymoseptoria tritici (strain ST99CH_3D7) TaxID=1276538 RepID=A0A1X7RQI0_ZYMT9|nr:unnamed protein product [Zymoseptoria tritici ST99CH_3D7]